MCHMSFLVCFLDMQSDAMDTWKRNALVSLESKLKVNLSLAGLLSQLERPAGGFMTEDERMSVDEEQGDSKKIVKIINILKKKGNAEFDIFLNMLIESGNEVWASAIEQKARELEKVHKAKGMEFSARVFQCVYHGLIVARTEIN